jgi:hypothetical protein
MLRSPGVLDLRLFPRNDWAFASELGRPLQAEVSFLALYQIGGEQTASFREAIDCDSQLSRDGRK